MLVATVSQVTRGSLKKRRPQMSDVAEDARKAGNCDVMLALGRSDNDVTKGVAGMSVLANREGRQGCHASFSLCYDIGQYCLSSWIGSDIDEAVWEGFADV